MSDEERIDFGPLKASPREYRRMVDATVARARRGAQPSLWAQLTRAAWPLLAGAALVSAAALALSPGQPAGSEEALTAEAFSDWANQGAIPRTVDLLSVAEGAGR